MKQHMKSLSVTVSKEVDIHISCSYVQEYISLVCISI